MDSDDDIGGRKEVTVTETRTLPVHEENVASDGDAAVHEKLRRLQVVLPDELVETVLFTRYRILIYVCVRRLAWFPVPVEQTEPDACPDRLAYSAAESNEDGYVICARGPGSIRVVGDAPEVIISPEGA
jgi:hypothetical protein